MGGYVPEFWRDDIEGPSILTLFIKGTIERVKKVSQWWEALCTGNLLF